MNITLELTASPSMLEALKLLAGFANPVNNFLPISEIINRTEPAPAPVEKIAGIDRAASETTRSSTATTTTATDTQTDVTIEQVRATTTVKAKSGKRQEVKALLAKYGTDSVTNLEPANYAAFYAEIEAL